MKPKSRERESGAASPPPADSLLGEHVALSPSPFVVLDAAGRILEANSAAEESMGGGSGLGGVAFLDTVAPQDRGAMERILTGEEGDNPRPGFVTLRHAAPSAPTRILQWAFTRHGSDADGPHLVGLAQEVTGFHGEVERFRALFDQESRYICLLAPDGRVLEANQRSLGEMRLNAADVVDVPFWATDWFARSPGAGERIQAAVHEAGEGKSTRLELHLPGPRDAFRTLDLTIRPVRSEDGRVTMLLSEGRDVTELRLARDRETSMLKALATIGESAAILAHEIKNPITAIHYALQAVATELGEDQKAVIDDLVDRLKLLEKMMRRTLSFTRPLDSHPIVCDVQELLEPVLGELRPLARRQGTRIELVVVEECPDVTADAELIAEVLRNLVTNALDAQEEGGRILIDVTPGEPGYVSVRIADDGPGIPESLHATLFKPFFTTKSSGTGLGLALCRKILEEHGGAIETAPSPLGGACFVVTLPAAG